MELPFEKHLHRRRIYLLRHAQALDGKRDSIEYPSTLSLTDLGKQQADTMREHLKDVEFDHAISSNIQRSIETAQIILKEHQVEHEISPLFAELEGSIKSLVKDLATPMEVKREVANFLWNVEEIFGDLITDMIARVDKAVEKLLVDDWSVLLLAAHGVFNRFLMCRLLGLDFSHIANFEQDHCCLNILDLDIDTETGKLERCVIRALNVTPYDHTKKDLRYTDGEIIAITLEKLLDKAFEEK